MNSVIAGVSPFKSITERTMGNACPDCHGKGYIQPPITDNGNGNINVGQIVKLPCPNPNCSTRMRQDILGLREFLLLEKKDVVLGRVKATVSVIPPMKKREELSTNVTLTDANPKLLTNEVFEAAHQSLRGEYREMFICSIDCDGNLYNFKGADRPKCGHLTTEIKPPQEKPTMTEPKSTNELPTDVSVDVVVETKPTPAPEPKPLSHADAAARWIIADLDKYSVWGDSLTISDWLKAHDMTLVTYNDDIQKAIVEDFKAELRVELERGGLKATQSTIFALFGVNKIEDALHTFSPDDIRKKVTHKVNEELKLKQQQEEAAEGQRRIDANQRAPLTNIIPPDNTTQSVAIPRPNPNAVMFGTGDPSFDLMVAKATIMLKSGLLPYTIKTVEQVITIGMMGQVLGLEMITAVNMIDVIGGRPAIKPQLMIALCRQKGLLEKMDIADDGTVCSVTMQRKGEAPYTATFSMEDAKRLTTSEGSGNERRVIPLADKKNWKEQPKVMRQWRAISAAMRVVFPDVILGMYTPDELESGEDGQSADPKVTTATAA